VRLYEKKTARPLPSLSRVAHIQPTQTQKYVFFIAKATPQLLKIA
jgi:hypothetical protein